MGLEKNKYIDFTGFISAAVEERSDQPYALLLVLNLQLQMRAVRIRVSNMLCSEIIQQADESCMIVMKSIWPLIRAEPLLAN